MKPILTYEVTGDELKVMGCGVIVEQWDKRKFGKGKRAWESENFTLAEKAMANKIYALAYDWELRRGYPQAYRCSLKSYLFLQRLCNFFGML